jgi:hypothetical protein
MSPAAEDALPLVQKLNVWPRGGEKALQHAGRVPPTALFARFAGR